MILLENYKELLEFAGKLADTSGSILRKGFQGVLNIETKADSSPVTQLDKDVEKSLRYMIEEAYPEHGIIGEEFGNIRESSPYQWIIDPIDGTKAFIAGYLTFTTLVALLHNGKPVIGIIDQPILQQRWAAISGQKTLYNGTPLPLIANKKSLEEANIATTSTGYFTDQQAIKLKQLKDNGANIILGGDAYAYAMLASGRVDIVLDVAMKPYDYCALVPIIEGAGGVITDWSGKPLNLLSDGSVIAAASKELHKACLAILSK
jgi:inositol-phosphate phosphatase/L-galactose 1-phosphate phosphatase/histidinol-phosphatase